MTAFNEKLQRVTVPSALLVFLEITHPAFTETVRVVSDTRDWVSNGETYIGLPFTLQLPEDADGAPATAQLVIDNVGRSLTYELEKVTPTDVMMAKIMIADSKSPDTIERSFYLPITSVQVDAATATASAGVDYIMRQQAVRQRSTPFTLPGIFQ